MKYLQRTKHNNTLKKNYEKLNSASHEGGSSDISILDTLRQRTQEPEVEVPII